MRIVVLDGHTLNPGDNPWDEVAALGDLEVYDRTPSELIVERARGATVVLTNKTPLSAEVISTLTDLRMISVLATGYDVVNVAAAAGRGIVVCNVPEYATTSVAEHVFALLLELARGAGRHDRLVREGAWAACGEFSFWQSAPAELEGKTLGVVGLGRIGRRVGEIAAALGMTVAVTATTPRRLPPAWIWIDDLDELLARADVVSLHCPLNERTRGMIGARRLALMKPSAFLINTARGGLIDERAVAEALAQNRLAGAAVDVVSSEPIAPDNPLLAAPRCIITPHMAWASLAARRRLMQATAENIRAFLAGCPVNVVS